MLPPGGAADTAAIRLMEIGGTSPATDGIADNEPSRELSCAEQKQGMDGSGPDTSASDSVERAPANDIVIALKAALPREVLQRSAFPAITRTRVRLKALYAQASLSLVQHSAGTLGMNTSKCLGFLPARHLLCRRRSSREGTMHRAGPCDVVAPEDRVK
jgi:hypothetical protein